LVLVSNQYGPNKISVYGFGRFPLQKETSDTQTLFVRETESENELEQQISITKSVTDVESSIKKDRIERQKKIAELYYSSMTFYRAGRLEEAREGLVKVLKSGLIPPEMIKTIQDDLAEIDNLLKDGEKKREIAELYYSSMAFYNAGRLEKAREGLVKVLKSGLIPPAMAKTVEKYLADIENSLNKK
jgi:hypothetical protein